MNNPIIFLDMDGVLNSDKHANRYSSEEWERLSFLERHIDNEAIELVNYICDKTNAQVVISSTWRYGRSAEQLQEILNQRGGIFKVIDKTPEYSMMYRGYEIDAWISRNRSKDENGNYFEFSNYAILDDDIGDMLMKQKDNIFEIDSHVGVTKIDADKIIIHLKQGG